MRRTFTFAILLALSLSAGSLSAIFTAGAQGSEPTIAASLSPDRANAKGSLRLTIDFGQGPSGATPAPVRRAVLRLPLGLGIEIPHLRSCSIPSSARARSKRLLGPVRAWPRPRSGRGHGRVPTDHREHLAVAVLRSLSQPGAHLRDSRSRHHAL